MGNKKYKTVKAPWDVGGDFSQENKILNYKPVFSYTEPPQEDLGEQQEYFEDIFGEELEDLDSLIAGYDSLAEMTDMVQAKIDDKVKTLGGVTINLDPVRDNAAIEAIKRVFPGQDPNKITYDMYKESLNKVEELSAEVPVVSMADIEAAKQDPLQTSFGNLDKQPGKPVPQFDPIKPINLEEFKQDQLKTLADLIWDLIKDRVKDMV